MLKKMLKSLLAVAAICALSSAAYAETSVSASVAAAFGMQKAAGADEADFKAMYEGGLFAKMSGESVSAAYKIAKDNNSLGAGDAYTSIHVVTWKMNDSFTMEIGSANGVFGPSLGKASLRTAMIFTPVNSANAGAPSITPGDSLQFNIGVGEIGTAYAGISPSDGDMAFYALFNGAAGDISYVVGMKTEPEVAEVPAVPADPVTYTAAVDAVPAKDAATNIGLGVAYKMGTMEVGFDYKSKDDLNLMALSFHMKELGPGALGFYYGTQSTDDYDAVIALKYAYAIEPGATLEADVCTQGEANYVGITLAKAF